MAQASTSDARSLQELAVDVVTDIHKLATGLAHAGAPPKITQQIEQTSELYSQIAKALAAGPVGQQATAAGPPPGAAPVGAPPGPPVGGPPPGPPSPGASPPGPGTPQAQAPAHGDLHNAIASMHRDSVNAAVKAGR